MHRSIRRGSLASAALAVALVTALPGAAAAADVYTAGDGGSDRVVREQVRAHGAAVDTRGAVAGRAVGAVIADDKEDALKDAADAKAEAAEDAAAAKADAAKEVAEAKADAAGAKADAAKDAAEAKAGAAEDAAGAKADAA